MVAGTAVASIERRLGVHRQTARRTFPPLDVAYAAGVDDAKRCSREPPQVNVMSIEFVSDTARASLENPTCGSVTMREAGAATSVLVALQTGKPGVLAPPLCISRTSSGIIDVVMSVRITTSVSSLQESRVVKPFRAVLGMITLQNAVGEALQATAPAWVYAAAISAAVGDKTLQSVPSLR
jgi:hypothetical protein